MMRSESAWPDSWCVLTSFPKRPNSFFLRFPALDFWPLPACSVLQSECFVLTLPNKGPPWTTGGTLFLGPLGWTSIRAVVKKISTFCPSFPNKRGVDFYLDRFSGVRDGPLFGHGTNKEGGPLVRGGGSGPFIGAHHECKELNLGLFYQKFE